MTSLSAGLIIRDLLTSDQGVAAITDLVFPVVAEDAATLPYICYRRAAIDDIAVKNRPGADTCTVDILCYAATYEGSIALAEAVRAALDNAQAEYTDSTGARLVARAIQLIDSEEAWQDDAYVQILTFHLKIN